MGSAIQDEDDTRLANLAFDDLIYKYNTDPGAFDNNKGYVVKNSKDGNSYLVVSAKYMM